MTKTIILPLFFLCSLVSFAHGAEELGSYLRTFDYAERIEMKISSKEFIKLFTEGKAQLIDIRFKEEYEAWHMAIARNIPINELPGRLSELDKSKVIVTACPHKDRAIMARTYLATLGYSTKYLKDGLIGLAENLRGDNAKDFILQTAR
ncbi:MAG: rhodanese-like domain-containing protein [Thermodesulfobacteriota bacterium]